MTPAEPPQMLDAIAANPEDEAAWHVLADWLLENNSPHAILAAYDLKLERGTNDPDLIGDYAQARRERHVLPPLRHATLGAIRWKCGYAVSATLAFNSWGAPDASEAQIERPLARELTALFAAPAMSALHALTVTATGWWERHADLLALPLETVTPSVRRLSVGPLSSLPSGFDSLRPPRGQRVDLVLDGLSAHHLGTIARAGWPLAVLTGSRLVRHEDLQQALRWAAGCHFVVGGVRMPGRGIGLPLALARRLDLGNVGWAPAGVRTALIDDDGGLYPLDPEQPEVLQFDGARVTRSLEGWYAHRDGARPQLLEEGGRFEGLTFRQVESVDEWYRALLRA